MYAEKGNVDLGLDVDLDLDVEITSLEIRLNEFS